MTESPIFEQYSVLTGNGTYIIKKPTGRNAIRHFNLMKKAFPTNYDEDGNPVVTTEDELRQEGACEQWCMMILPTIITEFPEGISDFEHMPGEDQYTIWRAMYNILSMGTPDGELFRIERVTK